VESKRYTKTILIDPVKRNVAVLRTVNGGTRYNKIVNLFAKEVMDTMIWENFTKTSVDPSVDKGVSIDVSNGIESNIMHDKENTWDVVQRVTRDEDNTVGIMGVDSLRPHDAASHSLLECHIRLGHLR
jgi:hypothetical protein